MSGGIFTEDYKDGNTLLNDYAHSAFTTWSALVANAISIVGGPPYFNKIICKQTTGGKVLLDTSKVVGKLGEILNTPIMAYNGTL